MNESTWMEVWKAVKDWLLFEWRLLRVRVLARKVSVSYLRKILLDSGYEERKYPDRTEYILGRRKITIRDKA